MLRVPKVLVVWGLLLFSTAAPAQEARIAWWSGEYEDAFVSAKERNVPLVFVIIMDGEEANERIVAGLFPDNDYVKSLKRAVPVILSKEGHALKKEAVDGEIKGVCAKFGGCPCAAHQKMEPLARAEFLGEVVQTPQHIYVLPDKDRTVVARIVDVGAPGEYVEALRKAQGKLGAGLGLDEFRAARRAVAEAERALAVKDYPAASKAAKGALDGVKGFGAAKKLEQALASVERAASAKLDEARAAEKSGDAYAAIKHLDVALKDFAGAELVGEIKKESARVRATKGGREAAKLLAREERAKPSWDAAEKAVSEKDFVRAKREFEKVLKTAEGTPLAGAAEKRIAAFMADPDLKALLERADREGAADGALRDAEKWLRDGEKDKAKAGFKDVVARFAGTKAAGAAQKRLDELK